MPDPSPVARLLAERVIDGRGEYRVTAGQLRALFRDRLPGDPAGKSPTAAALTVRAARAELRGLGIDFRRHKLVAGPRVWTFRLTADPS